MVIVNRLRVCVACFVCVAFSIHQGHDLVATPMSVAVSIKHEQPAAILPWCPSYPDDSPVVDQLKVATATASATSSNSSQTNHRAPTILCFILTYSGNRAKTKVAVNTWGKRCDKLIVASDVTDPSINAIKMKTDATYADLWFKLQETMAFVYKEYGDQYDWFLKADDDSYYIMENLRDFLSSPQVQQHDTQKTPLIYGHLFGFDSKNTSKIVVNATVPQATPMHTDVSNDTGVFIYPSGGAGYVMNRRYVESFVDVIQKHSHEMNHTGKPEDLAQAEVMLYYRGVRPQSSRNEVGQERFHPADPITSARPMKLRDPRLWHAKHHAKVGGMKKGMKCCPPSSIAFHYVKPELMHYMDYKLYSTCREWPKELPAYLYQEKVTCKNGTRSGKFPNITPANVAARSAKMQVCLDTDEIVYSPGKSSKKGWLCCGINNASAGDDGNVTEAYRANDHWNIYRRPKLAFHEFKPSIRIHKLGTFSTVDECRQAVLIDPECLAGENGDFVWNHNAKTCQCSSEKLTTSLNQESVDDDNHHYVDSLHSHVFRK